MLSTFKLDQALRASACTLSERWDIKALLGAARLI
jgi:hypothetical protein